MWRYVIKRADNGQVVYDGWSSELLDAVETADRKLTVLCDEAEGLPKAS